MSITHRNSFGEDTLTPHLAHTDQEEYGKRVFDLYNVFGAGTIKGANVTRKLLDDRDFRSIKFDPDTWVGRANDGHITLGVASIDSAMREKIIFEDRKFTGDREVLYRLSHELSHFVGPSIERILPRHLGNIYGAIINSRRQVSRGLSALGSLDYYKSHGPKLQAHEDITELINMYLIDPSYLRRFLSFLEQSDDARLANRGLMKLDSGIADFIFKTIESGIHAWLLSKKP